MQLKECNIGILVQEVIEKPARLQNGRPAHGRISHVVGLTINGLGETIPVINWAIENSNKGEIMSVHSQFLKVLE